MSSAGPAEPSERERQMQEIIAAFLAAEDAGQRPDPAVVLKAHPELADELGAFFRSYDRIGRLAAPLRAVAREVEITEQDPGTAFSASPGPPGGVPEATQASPATGALAPSPPEDRDATAPVTPDGASDNELLEPGSRVRYFGDYELQSVLGRGGMGVVYKARQISLNRTVALKMLRTGALATDDDLRRFQNEAEAVAMLDHPHIVPILEVGQHQEQRYFSMKLIDGQSLDCKLSGYTDDPKAAAQLVRTVAEAVHHAHQRGILHRDLKPGNVLIDERGQPHVTDFGLAKRAQAASEVTQTGAILGTPAYMAPEQAAGRREMVTTATDVYGLGAILYALLTGRAPFGGDSPIHTLEQVRERTAEPPSKRNPRVPRDMEVICLKCLEKDSARRYASAEALADDLRRYITGEPILARPVRLATRAWMWCKRKPTIAGLAAALLLAAMIFVLGGITVVTIEGARRREFVARQEAETNFDLAFKAVDSYLTNVSENTLLKEQDSVDIRNLRQQLLQNALKYYQQFAQQRSRDPRLQKELAKAYFRVGSITQEIGSPHEALESLGSARSIWERLVAAEPHDDELKANLAACYVTIGTLQQKKLGNFSGALKVLADARSILEPLVASHPDQATYQASLAECLSEIGIIEAQQESTDKAVEMLNRARSILRALIKQAPDVIGYKSSLAEVINNMGYVYYKKADYRAAIKSYEELRDFCLALLQGITVGPKPVWLLNRLARTYYNIASMQAETTDIQGALQSFRKSLEYRTMLAHDHPVVTEYHENLGVSYREIGRLLQYAHQDKEALDFLEKSLGIFERLVHSYDYARFRSELALSWNALGIFYDEARRDNARAIPPFEQAVAEQKRATQMSQDVNEYKVYLSNHLENLGEQYLDLGNVDAGLPSYKRAIEIRQKLHSAHPETWAYSLEFADALVKLGAIQRHTGDSRAALNSFSEARGLFESLADKAPADAKVALRRAIALVQEAVATAEAEKPSSAIPLLQRAVEELSPLVREGSDLEAREALSKALWHLARIHRLLNGHADAARLDAQRTELWKGRPAVELADLALKELAPATLIAYGKSDVPGRARAVREQDLDLAAAHLRLAIDNGFADLNKLNQNRDFGILKAHDGVEALIKRLESSGRLGSPEAVKK
jgi:tetratricopeptide (TPR) repeat protein/tRNA A-37 threonylcarbamoyl transferase component Bud32